MNYELAKKLKDAGFPQAWPKPDFLELHDALEVQKIYDKYPEQLDPYRPTLSELIESCGNKFGYLSLRDTGVWVANSDGSHEDIEADTPEEAVAKLWIKLHKK